MIDKEALRKERAALTVEKSMLQNKLNYVDLQIKEIDDNINESKSEGCKNVLQK